MRSIIITGESGSGKSQLARTIGELSGNWIDCQHMVSMKDYLDTNTKVVIFDQLSTESELSKFKEIICLESFEFIPKYSNYKRNCSPLIIGVFQALLPSMKEMEIKNCQIFNLIKL